MPKSGQWRDIFKKGKQKLRVQVGNDEYTEMTTTQAHRFGLLNEPRRSVSPPNNDSCDADLFSFSNAAARYGLNEPQLLERASKGTVLLFVDAAGKVGRWRIGQVGDDRSASPDVTLTKAHLALTTQSCHELLQFGNTRVSEFLHRVASDPSATAVDGRPVESQLGRSNRYFCLAEPLWIDTTVLVLLSPLPRLAK